MAPFMVGDWGWGRSLPGQDPEGHPPSHTAAPAVRAARECVLGKIENSSPPEFHERAEPPPRDLPSRGAERQSPTPVPPDASLPSQGTDGPSV